MGLVVTNAEYHQGLLTLLVLCPEYKSVMGSAAVQVGWYGEPVYSSDIKDVSNHRDGFLLLPYLFTESNLVVNITK